MVSGILIEEDNKQPVPFAYIASYTQHLMYSSDSTGKFYIQLPVHDSLKIVMLGFEPVTVKLDSLIPSDMEYLIIPLKRSSYLLNSVNINLQRGFFNVNDTEDSKPSEQDSVITGFGQFVDIREVIALQRAKSGTFGITPGTIMMIVRFFKKRKKPKKTRIFKYDNQHFKELTSHQNLSLFTGFKGAKLDSFVIFLEKHYAINPKLSDYEIMKVVKNASEEFVAMNE